MKSPFTGGDVSLHTEILALTFRKETFDVVSQYYVCCDTGERFTTTGQDNLAINNLYDQYRERHGIPFADEISELLDRYGLSAAKMSKILGFGENQYLKYTKGEIPNISNGRMIAMVSDSGEFGRVLDKAKNELSEDDFEKISKKLSNIRAKETNVYDLSINRYIFTQNKKSAYTGYVSPQITKVRNIIAYFVQKLDGVYETKLNKLLFYTDFYSFKKYGRGISGLCYKAIDFGPVPCRYSTIYDNIGGLKSEIVTFSSGNAGKKILSDGDVDMSVFSTEEVEIMEKVCERFKNYSAVDISKISHEEEAWKQNIDTHGMIRYDYGFGLNAL